MLRSLRLLLALGSLLLACGAVAAPEGTPQYAFYGRGPYRSNVPRPETILGYDIGKTHTTFREQERVLLAIADAAKDRVRVMEYGKSVEGRPLRLIAVSSPENLSRLEAIRGQIAKLADPRRLSSPAEADAILRETPTLTWINQCIHGDETASFESAMWLLYTLAASDAPEIADALKKSVVLLNPVYNPDGHERFVVYYNSIAVGSPEPWAFERSIPWGVRGRYNHFRFDLNRDKIAQSQPETRQETAAVLHWNPQVYVDQHGQPPVYFFPPNSLPTNRHVDRDRVKRWTELFGRANAKVFDAYGWAYVNRETYDFFYPGYLDSFTTLTGAIGMTYETDGGGNLARRRDDDTVATLRDAAAHHFEAALTTIGAAAANREALLRDYLAFHRKGMEPGPGPMRRVVVLTGADPGRAAELASLLTRVGVEVREAAVAFESGSAHRFLTGKDRRERRTFPAGSLVVDLAQPQGQVARAFLDPNTDLEPEFVKEQLGRRDRNEKRGENEPREGFEFYDVTGWALPLTFGAEAYWTEDAPDVEGAILTLDTTGGVRLSARTGGVTGGRGTAYLFRFDRDAAAVLALRLLQEEFRLSASTKPISVGREEWPRGTLIARASRNPETLPARLGELASSLGVDVRSVASTYSEEAAVGIGSDNVVALRRPRIAVAADDVVWQGSFGSVWHLLDQAGLAFTSVRLQSLTSTDISRFNVIILPDGGGYAHVFGKDGVSALKEWVRRGGVLIGLGGGGTWFTEKDVDISSARRVGDEDDRQKNEEDAKEVETKKPRRPLELPGTIFMAKIDPTHFLGYGYPAGEIAVPLSGETFLKPSKTGANVITFGKAPLKLSGFIWPDNTEPLLAETAYVIDEPIGQGHALLYLDDPTFRALWPGLRRLFLSGILFGTTGSHGGEDAH